MSQRLEGYSVGLSSYEDQRKIAILEAEDVLKKRIGYKLATIANPANGEDFFSDLYTLDWEKGDHICTVEKLKVLAAAKLPPAR